MTRDKMLHRLHQIEFSAQPTVATMDMGLQYEYASKDGCGSDFGNMGDWPAYKITGLTREQFDTIQKKILKNSLQVEDLENTPLLSLYNYAFSMWRPEGCIPTIISFFRDLGEIKLPSDGTIYALCDSCAWELKASFFGSYDEMEQGFCDEYASYIQPWEDLDDEELQEWLDKIEDELSGILLNELGV